MWDVVQALLPKNDILDEKKIRKYIRYGLIQNESMLKLFKKKI